MCSSDLCGEVGHDMVAVRAASAAEGVLHCFRTIHAEMNAVLSAAFLGACVRRCDWYVTGVPCWQCIRSIVRLEPLKLFLCSNRGGNDNWEGIFKWLENRQRLFGYPTSVFSESFENLESRGIVI